MTRDMLPDVHSETPRYPVIVNSVGISGVKMMPLVVGSGVFIPLFSAYVDLPRELRGAHLSRLYRVLQDSYHLIQERGFEALHDIAKKILEANDYATNATVEVYGDYFFEHQKSLSYATIESSVMVNKNLGIRNWTSQVEVESVITCPCALKVSNYLFNTSSTHMQKARVLLRIESGSRFISPLLLLELLRNILNMPLNLLTREEEAVFVNKLFSEPEFTEDTARKVLTIFLGRYCKILDPNDYVIVKIVSLETIHQYQVVSLIEGPIKDFASCQGEKA